MAIPDPALDLFLRCLAGQTDKTTMDGLRRFSPQIWGRTVQLAQRHNVEALFYARLKILDTTTIPTATLQTLQQATHLAALKLAGLYQELAAILEQLQKHTIPVIVLKGAYLGQIVYHNSTVRSMSDIDILVHQRDLPRATAVMELRGYHLQNGAWGTKHLAFNAADGRPPVEIHWHIIHPADPFEVDVETLWVRAAPTTVAKMPALAFSPEDLILHLALHASFNHGFRFGLRPFCDIHEVINYFGDTIEWQTVIRRAHRWQIAHALYLTLHLTVELLATTISNETLEMLQPDDFTPEMTTWAKKRILEGDAIPFISSNFARIWKEKRLRDKTAVFLKCVLPPPETVIKQSERSHTDSIRQFGTRLRRYGHAGWQLWWRNETMRRDVTMKNWLASG